MDEENASSTTGFDDVHTLENPYCNDPQCWCHTSISYHDVVIHPTALTSEEEWRQIYAFHELTPSW